MWREIACEYKWPYTVPPPPLPPFQVGFGVGFGYPPLLFWGRVVQKNDEE